MSISKLGKVFAIVPALAMSLGLSSFLALAAPAYAAPASCTGGPTSSNPLDAGAQCAAPNNASDNLFGAGGIFQTIANTLIFLVGAVAVLFLIIGGLRYVISNGDPKAVEAAKQTILYAIIGIVVAILAFAAVQFVITTFQ
ncbi:MAG TPA: pilin [Candidatus Saccharimonas sp.]|nr:pilin [Candidatus Saccharimonas sp.]